MRRESLRAYNISLLRFQCFPAFSAFKCASVINIVALEIIMASWAPRLASPLINSLVLCRKALHTLLLCLFDHTAGLHRISRLSSPFLEEVAFRVALRPASLGR
jgi:hypothetical protein